MGATSDPGAKPPPHSPGVLCLGTSGRRDQLRRLLTRDEFCWMLVDDVRDLHRALEQESPDLVVLDPATLRTLLGQTGSLPSGGASVLSGFGMVAQLLEAGLDPRALLERLLGTLHLELQLPCAFLSPDPQDGDLTLCSQRGVGGHCSQFLRLQPDDPQLASRELVQLEADLEGSRLEAWCARTGHPRLALAPIHGQKRFHGGLLVLANGPEPFRLHDLALLTAVSGQAALLLDNLELEQVAWTRQRLVEKLLERVINAQEEERKWMAAEIHDTIAQSLVGMHTMVQTCRQLLRVDPDRAGTLLDDLCSLLSESLGEIRQILFNLRPASLDDLGLVPSLENCARRFLEGTGIQLTLELPGRNQSRLPPLLETTVFRIAQEALSNIKKHSGARRARVSLDVGTTDLRLTVSDDGRGLVWSEVSRRFQSGDSHGLHGMQERSRLLGGHFRISNDPFGGTILEVVIPLAGPGPSSREADLGTLLRRVLGGEGYPGFPEVSCSSSGPGALENGPTA